MKSIPCDIFSSFSLRRTTETNPAEFADFPLQVVLSNPDVIGSCTEASNESSCTGEIQSLLKMPLPCAAGQAEEHLIVLASGLIG